MFKKTHNSDPATATPPRIGEVQPIRSRNVSVIGPTLFFRGELSADEDLVIEGTIEGSIAHHKKNLTIGKHGKVTADIHASAVIVEGELNGDIHCDGLVSLATTARVNGNIYCARVTMDDGAQFTGKIDMTVTTPLKVADEPTVIGDGLLKSENLTA
jgi:cytoskeletal protein CcmA (bactofilin family)